MTVKLDMTKAHLHWPDVDVYTVVLKRNAGDVYVQCNYVAQHALQTNDFVASSVALRGNETVLTIAVEELKDSAGNVRDLMEHDRLIKAPLAEVNDANPDQTSFVILGSTLGVFESCWRCVVRKERN